MPESVIVELLNRRFDSIDVRLDDLTEQVRETNGRLRTAEGHIANFHPRVRTLEREMSEVRKSPTGENRRIRVWDVGMVALGISAAMAFLKLIGKL